MLVGCYVKEAVDVKRDCGDEDGQLDAGGGEPLLGGVGQRHRDQYGRALASLQDEGTPRAAGNQSLTLRATVGSAGISFLDCFVALLLAMTRMGFNGRFGYKDRKSVV